MSDIHPPDVANIPSGNSDGLEERGQGAGRLLGEGAEQSIAGEEVEGEQDGEELPDGTSSSDHQADES